MPAVAAKVWTTGRKWLANGIPGLFFLPLAIAGAVIIIRKSEFLGLGLWLLVGSVVVGWIALNFFGLVGNAFMKRQLKREIGATDGLPADAVFVGFASPKYQSVLDPHEDVGYLVFRTDRLEFIGETERIKIPKGAIETIRFRPNIHTWVGLGRWISVEGKVEGKPIRLLIEPREKKTLFGNLVYGKALRDRIRGWRDAER